MSEQTTSTRVILATLTAEQRANLAPDMEQRAKLIQAAEEATGRVLRMIGMVCPAVLDPASGAQFDAETGEVFRFVAAPSEAV